MKKKRSDIYREKYKKKPESKIEKNFTQKDKRKNSKKKIKAKKGLKYTLRRFFIAFLLLFILAIAIFFLTSKNPQQSIDAAMESIKEMNVKKQNDYFEKIDEITATLQESYIGKESRSNEFAKAVFENLEYKIEKIEKNKDGTLKAYLEIKNSDFVDVYNNTNKKSEDFYSEYLKNLRNPKNKKIKTECELILVKKFHGYRIFESEEFVSGILGGEVLKN